MSEPADILGAERGRTRRTVVVGIACVAAAGAWAAWSLQATAPTRAAPVLTPESVPLQRPRIVNAGAFDAQLDHPKPAPVVAAPAPPPAPLRINLLAIARCSEAHGALEAWVYDAAQDAVVRVRLGDTIAGRRIQRIWAEGMEVADAHGPRRLLLDESTNGGIAGGAK